MHFIAPALAATGMEFGLTFGIAGLAIGALFGLLGMYLGHRRRVLWHETARIALEKGQPIPVPPPDSCGNWSDASAYPRSGSPAEFSHQRARHRSRGLLISGMVNIAVGLGMYVAFSQFAGKAAYAGAIPAFIGVAFIAGAAIELWFAPKPPQTSARPNQP